MGSFSARTYKKNTGGAEREVPSPDRNNMIQCLHWRISPAIGLLRPFVVDSPPLLFPCKKMAKQFDVGETEGLGRG